LDILGGFMKKLIILFFVSILMACNEPVSETTNEKQNEEYQKKDNNDIVILNTGDWERIAVFSFSEDYGGAKNGLINNCTSNVDNAENSERNFIDEPLKLTTTVPDDLDYEYKIGAILTFWNGVKYCGGHYTYHIKGKSNGVDFYISDSFHINLEASKVIHNAGVVNSIAKFEANEKIDVEIYTSNMQLIILDTSRDSNTESGINGDLQLGLYRHLKDN
jgi:hypothetical protein